MFDIIRSEYSMTDTAVKRDPDDCVVKPCLVNETKAYYVEATGASVTADSSVSLLTKYCEKLPGDKYGSHVFNLNNVFTGASCFMYTNQVVVNPSIQDPLLDLNEFCCYLAQSRLKMNESFWKDIEINPGTDGII